MTPQLVPDDAPGNVLFPEYATLYDLVAREVEGLTEAQLDFSSHRWAWAEWSIRRQLSHMAFAIYMWLLVRWGKVLFPEGDHGVEDVQGLTDSGFDRSLDEHRYWEVSVILPRLREAIELAGKVLAQRNVGFLRNQTLLISASDAWRLMIQAHPHGVTPADAPGQQVMTLEATFRHLYFEALTHLYNMQRLKRAQRLPTVVDTPRVGYWVLEAWDRSEASNSTLSQDELGPSKSL
jgi:hypothetical protein